MTAKLPESEWQRRREVGLTCVSWREYYDKLHLVYTPGHNRVNSKHGVKILCYNCKKNPADKMGIYKIFRNYYCDDCFTKLLSENKIYTNGKVHFRDYDWMNKARSLVKYVSDEKLPDKLACSLAHHTEQEAFKILKQIDELRNKYVELNADGKYHESWHIEYEVIPQLEKDAKAMLLSSQDKDNPFTDPVFLKKLFDGGENGA
jgi:hypothetical protein